MPYQISSVCLELRFYIKRTVRVAGWPLVARVYFSSPIVDAVQSLVITNRGQVNHSRVASNFGKIWSSCGKGKGKATPVQAWEFQKVQVPKFRDNRHMTVVRLWALHIDGLYSLGNIPGTHLCWGRGGTVVKVLRYKSEGRWFDSRWCHWNFSLT